MISEHHRSRQVHTWVYASAHHIQKWQNNSFCHTVALGLCDRRIDEEYILIDQSKLRFKIYSQYILQSYKPSPAVSPLGTKSIIQYISHLVILQMLLVMDTIMEFFWLPFSLFPKVSSFFLSSSLSIISNLAMLLSVNKRQRKWPEFQWFMQQLYHMCLSHVFAPLQSGMMTPEVVCCPDGHFWRAIYSLGPIILNKYGLWALFKDSVPSTKLHSLHNLYHWWNIRCEADPQNLDYDHQDACCHGHERSNFIVKCFDLGTIWENYGIWSDVVVHLTFHFGPSTLN